jgi:hypothetical protein
MRAIASLPLVALSLLFLLVGQSHGQKKDGDKAKDSAPPTGGNARLGDEVCSR